MAAKRSNADAIVDASLRRHPCQRFESPSRGFSATIHFLGLCSFAYSFKYLVDYPNRMSEAYGWHFQFITIIGLLLATITYALGLLSDLSLSPLVFRAKNALSIASAPWEVLVTALYWGLTLIDPALVFPADLPRLPFLTDISFHATPGILLAVDVLFLSPPWSISAIPAAALSAALAVAYWFWVERCYAMNQFYPYPIFDIDRNARLGLFAGSALISSASILGFKWVYAKLNGVHLDQLGGIDRKKRR